jgi:type IV pilus assembly protein PilA
LLLPTGYNAIKSISLQEDRKDMKESTRFRCNRALQSGEKGFTLIELLIVIAVLGVLAAVIIPNVGNFIKSGNLAAANAEVSTLKTTEQAFYADYGVNATSVASNLTSYLGTAPVKGTYTITSGALAPVVATDYWTVTAGLKWDADNQLYTK